MTRRAADGQVADRRETLRDWNSSLPRLL